MYTSVLRVPSASLAPSHDLAFGSKPPIYARASPAYVGDVDLQIIHHIGWAFTCSHRVNTKEKPGNRGTLVRGKGKKYSITTADHHSVYFFGNGWITWRRASSHFSGEKRVNN
ncbi:unnamed protein product [Periconia digitata]|uniref:Uncharacterized protein n=1 Tax=Periconia digitata TaxID=1303443 RepID=A0A9W4ULT0_9PLEO|nr:unnamed protein product [Periconia digitata]